MDDSLTSSFTSLVKQASAFDVTLSEETGLQCRRFAEHLVAANETRNLTRLASADRLVVGMFLDSLLLVPRLRADLPERVVDVGCGAGFPSVPLALALPSSSFVAIDSRLMKCRFIEETVASMGVTNVQAVHGRAEDLGKRPEMTGRFDVALARALGSLVHSLELCLPFVHSSGRLVIVRGTKSLDDDLRGAASFVRQTGLHLRRHRYRLPGYDSDFVQLEYRLAS